jgi:predicted ester cyclase
MTDARPGAGRGAGRGGGDVDDEAARVCLAFLDGLNDCDLDRAEAAVDVARWREICVGFTNGVIRWPDSRASMEAVWAGVPDIRFEPQHSVSDGRHVAAVGRVHGTQTGRLFGAPTTRRSYDVSMFDYVTVEDGKIVDRIQQADMFGPMSPPARAARVDGPDRLCRLLFGAGLLVGAGAFVRLGAEGLEAGTAVAESWMSFSGCCRSS